MSQDTAQIEVTALSPREQHERDISTIRNFLVYFADEFGRAEQIADAVARLNADLVVKMDEVEIPDPDACKECIEDEERKNSGALGIPAPTNWWHCQDCNCHISRWRGQGEVHCPVCGAEYNAGGQRLRDDWRGNTSNYDDDISDMDGYEAQHAGDEW